MQTPRGMGWLYVVTIWVHIVAAAAWIGSMLFFAFVVVPAMRDPSAAAGAAPLLRVLGARYRTFGWTALGTLIASGTVSLYFRGVRPQNLVDLEFWSVGFGRTLAWKLLFLTLVLMATMAHDRRGARDASASPEAARAYRRRASLLGRATLLLSLAVVFFAVQLVRGAP